MRAEHVEPIEPGLAKAMIRSLARGTAIAAGARYLHVGHDQWLGAQLEILGELAEDGYSETKFVRGTYGAGKSHFLAVVQELARERGWVTAHIECHFDRVEVDRFETLYPALVKKLNVKVTDASVAIGERGVGDTVRYLLERWTDVQLQRVGLQREARSRPFDADIRLFEHLAQTVLRSGVPASFARAVSAYAMAVLARDLTSQNAICAWLCAATEHVDLPEQYFQRTPRLIGKADSGRSRRITLKAITAGTVHEAMRGLLWLIRDSGLAGLVLCIDEVEELARLTPRKRQDRALQALREYVDHAGGDEGYRFLSMYLAATPEMFDGEQYFPRYDALASRIQPVSDSVSWRGPVIDLDRTPLSASELKIVASRVRELYRVGYGEDACLSLTDEVLASVVDEIVKSKLRIARPRLLARLLITELDRARKEGHNYSPPAKLQALVARAAANIQPGE